MWETRAIFVKLARNWNILVVNSQMTEFTDKLCDKKITQFWKIFSYDILSVGDITVMTKIFYKPLSAEVKLFEPNRCDWVQ